MVPIVPIAQLLLELSCDLLARNRGFLEGVVEDEAFVNGDCGRAAMADLGH
jgi:hypothetical protein